MTTSTKILTKLRFQGRESTLRTLVGVWAAASTVALLQAVLPWRGTPREYLLIAAACAAFALLSGWFFRLRGRILQDPSDRLAGVAYLILAAHFLLRLVLAVLQPSVAVLALVTVGSWVTVNAAAGLAFLSVGLGDLPAPSRRTRAAMLAGSLLLAAAGGWASLVLPPLFGAEPVPNPIGIGLAVLFIVAGVVPLLASLRTFHRRDLTLGGSLLLLGAAHGDLAWQSSLYDTPFMWGHLLLAFAFTVPLIGTIRENVTLLGRQIELNRRIKQLGRRIELLLESLPTLVLTVDSWSRVQYANAAAARLFGVPAGLTRGAAADTWLERLGAPDRELLRDRIRRVHRGELPSWEGTVTVVDAAGSSHWLQVQLHPLFDPVEEKPYVELVGSDVTELLLARRSAEERQERLALLSNVAQAVSGERQEESIIRLFLNHLREWIPARSVCLYRPSPDGATLQRVVAVGDADPPWPQLIHQADHPAWRALRETFAVSVSRETDTSGGSSPGVLYLPLFAAGTTVGVLAMGTRVHLTPGAEEADMLTQLGILLGGALHLAALIRELEEQRAIALQASRIKSEFLANTSHELRTPLTSILGFLRLILDGAVRDPAKEQEFLRIAHDSAERLLAIINDVLDLAKIEAGRLEVSPTAVPAQEILNDIQRLFVHQMRNKAVTFDVRPAPAGTVLLADPQRLRQILTNLLSNALKFTPRSGRIQVTVTRKGSEAVFEVTDTGPGIPSEELDRVF